MLETFHFLRPAWLVLLVPMAILLLLIRRAQDPRRAWRGLIANHLLDHLMVRPERRRWLQPIHLLVSFWGLSLLALAGPTWRREPAPFADDSAALVIALKVTPSMLAGDVPPTRLQRAIHKTRDLLALRPGAKTALVAYAGSAHLVMPLTRDARIIESFVADLTPEVMPLEGDETAQAVALAHQQLQGAAAAGSIVLITDGVADDQLPRLGELRQRGGAPVHLLAVGAESASVAATGPSAPALDRQALLRAARACGGSLTMVAPDDRDVQRLVGQIKRRFEAVEPTIEGERWQDAGYWLVPVVALLCLVWSRPGWVVRWTAVLVWMLGTPPSLPAAPPSTQTTRPADAAESAPITGFRIMDLWLTRDQQAMRLHRAGAFGQAARLFEDPLWRGVALYRAGQFEQAADQFARVDTAEAAFNRGNALVMLGKYEDAIGAYDHALQFHPQWLAAVENRRLAALRRDRLKPAGDDAGGTGGQLAADELVFDGQNGKSGQQAVELGAEGPLNSAELRALWLRRVQTRPADFLRARFNYQLARDRSEGEVK